MRIRQRQENLRELLQRFYKQWAAELERLEVGYSEGHAQLKGALVVELGRIPGVTVWSENPQRRKKNGWNLSVSGFAGTGVGNPAVKPVYVPALAVCCHKLNHCTFLGLPKKGRSVVRQAGKNRVGP